MQVLFCPAGMNGINAYLLYFRMKLEVAQNVAGRDG